MSTGYHHRHSTPSHYTGGRLVSAIVSAVIVLGAIVFSAAPASALTNPLLNSQQVDSSDISPFTKWTSLMPRYEMQRAAAESKCIGEGCKNQQWEKLLTALEGKPVQEQIDSVNKFFNNMKYITDQNNYGTTDYWNTPYELMERGGDCEDYAIAKYISLKRLGVSESDMRILIVKDQKLNGTLHAILEVNTDGTTQILDNQAKNVIAVAKIFHYNPVYAINENKWWAYK